MQPFRPASLVAPAVLGLGLLLAGCQKPPAAEVEAPPPLPPHLGPPPAATCVVSPVKVSDGGTAEVTMTISNDGGYCAASLLAGNGQPYDAPLVPRKPLHGEETVVKYNSRTSIEYAAVTGYVGPDTFTVHLIERGQPGYTTVNVSVVVQAPGTLKNS